MNLSFYLHENSLSGSEFIGRSGPLVDEEVSFLKRTRDTVQAHLEPITDRVERYHSYFNMEDEDFHSLTEAVATNTKRLDNAVALHELSTASSQAVYTVELGHTNIRISRCASGEVNCSREEPLVKVLRGHEVVASDLFNWIASTLHQMIPPQESSQLIKNQKFATVVFATTHDVSEDGNSIARLNGGFREKKPTETTFRGLNSDDPVTHVPIKELMNYALKCGDVPARCVAFGPSSLYQLASNIVEDYDPYAFLAINLTDGFHASATVWGTNNSATIRQVDFDGCNGALPANNIDQNYNFMQCRSRATNPLSRMISTESIADLTRMMVYHIFQEMAPAVCWENGSLTTADVLKTVYEPEQTKGVLKSWLKLDSISGDIVSKFQTICSLVVRRTQILLAAVIAGCAEASGRCYEAFGISRCIVVSDDIGKYPVFLQGVQDLACMVVDQGKIEIIHNNKALVEGASVIANNPEAVRKILSH